MMFGVGKAFRRVERNSWFNEGDFLINNYYNVRSSCSVLISIFHLGWCMERGFSSALISRPGRSAVMLTSGNADLMHFARTFRVQSCLQVYLPCSNVAGQVERMW